MRSATPSSICRETRRIEDLVLFLVYATVLNGVLCVGCLVADYIFPHIPFIERYLESLPDWDED